MESTEQGTEQGGTGGGMGKDNERPKEGQVHRRCGPEEDEV